ncbi:uncharacterized protein LOC132557891 [Ylistrum balloti]|uniref:uncharacterized protein LOC132557891 n=1 Tax=Ylistrum balloti TaxID=509963 RepID=UPI002905D93D|nr:uncharacterized protein LOC132557891 [Ylistrum balloti]
MDGKKILVLLLFIYISYTFIVKFGKEQFDDLLLTLKKYPHVECPKGYMLYKIYAENITHYIQTQQDFSEKRTQDVKFRRCEQEYLKDNITCDGNSDGTAQSSCIVSYPGDADVLHEACISTENRYKSDALDYIPDKNDSRQSVFSRLLAYFTEVVYGSIPEKTDVGEREADIKDYSLLQGIFPGTRWCGFGNIADDVFTNLGEHQHTDSCCRSHDLCEPKIRALQKRYYYNNQGIIPISHCSCDRDFYNCLKGVNSPVSNKIGRIFFNIAKIKCFDFAVSDVCTLELMGVCLIYGQKCAAALKQSPVY